MGGSDCCFQGRKPGWTGTELINPHGEQSCCLLDISSHFAAHTDRNFIITSGLTHHSNSVNHRVITIIDQFRDGAIPLSAAIIYCVRSLVPMEKKSTSLANLSAIMTAAGTSIIISSAGRFSAENFQPGSISSSRSSRQKRSATGFMRVFIRYA